MDLGHDFREVREGTRFTISDGAKRKVLRRRLADLFSVNLDYFYRAKEDPFEVLLRAPEAAEDVRPALRRFSERCVRCRQIEEAAGVPVSIVPDYSPPPKGALVVSFAESLAEGERLRLGSARGPAASP